LLRDHGEIPIGFKLGFTSQAMRKQLGVLNANFGILTNAMLVDADRGLDTTKLTHPRAEPEAALRLALALSCPVERRRAESAIGACAAAVEIVDSRFHNYQFALEDNITDNSSAAARVLDIWRDAPSNSIVLKSDSQLGSEIVEEDDSGAAMGGLVDALLEAARLANAWGHMLSADEIILTGGLTYGCPICSITTNDRRAYRWTWGSCLCRPLSVMFLFLGMGNDPAGVTKICGSAGTRYWYSNGARYRCSSLR
jgi:2-oxo-3-hexenedioate decarboxylase